jgi:phosphatidate cytidylyltransferase
VLKTRVITAVILAVVFVTVVLALPPAATVAMLTLIVLGGAWEWSAFVARSSRGVRLGYVAVIGAAMLGTWELCSGPGALDAVLGAAVAWWLVAFVWIVALPGRGGGWAAAVAGLCALVPAWLALVKLRLELPQGALWVLFTLVLVWVADIGAFFAGRRFGRLKLAPRVSPGKTWEGVFGGLALTLPVAWIGSGLFAVRPAVFVPLCIATVAFSIVGDLTESLFKRHVGLKDSGTLIPGHGGVMDRIDSVTAAAPVLAFGLLTLGVAP